MYDKKLKINFFFFFCFLMLKVRLFAKETYIIIIKFFFLAIFQDPRHTLDPIHLFLIV